MKKLLEKFIYNSSNNGLLLVDMPTGLGKSTNVRWFIKDYLKNADNKKKILYITGLKKNLEEEKFRNEFGDDVLFLNNNTDTLIQNYNKVKDKLPKQILSHKLVRRLEGLINTINQTNDYNLKNEARSIINDDIEKEFRAAIEEFISFDEKTGSKLSIADKKKLIKTTKYSWIAELYPAALTDEKKIILMSMDKFLARNSTIIEPSYSIFNSKLIEDSIIFIDEFDSTKDIVLKNIIQTGLLNKINIVDLFRLIYVGLSDTDFTNELMQESEKLKQDKQDNSKKKSPKELIEILKNDVLTVYEKYSLNYFQKLDKSLKTNEAFLFHDYTFKAILKEESKLIEYDVDESELVIWIKGVDKLEPKDDADINIISMLYDIKRVINHFKNCVYFLAINYVNKKNESNRLSIYDHYKMEAAIKTVLAEFCIEGSYANFIYELISPRLIINQTKTDSTENKTDFSIYQHGFNYYVFMDNELYDTQSKIQFYSYNNTPEKFLLELCKQTKVVGISATATLPSVISNYDIEYLGDKLKDALVLPSKSDTERIISYFNEYSKHYKNVKIHPISIDINQENYYSYLVGFDENTKKEIELLFKKIDTQIASDDYTKDNNFPKSRYVKLFYVYKYFLENERIKSLIFLTNRTLKKQNNDIFNIDDAQKVFDTIKQNIDIKEIVFEKSLYGEPENFTNHKNEVLERLKNGEKGFIVSTYQTLGAGQNIQYEIPLDVKDDLVQVNEFTYNENSKDFDAIFIDRPTNVFARVGNQEYFGMSKDEILAKHVFQLKFLEQVGEISLSEVENSIKNAFRQTYLTGGYNNKNPECLHLKVASAKVIQQAIGRICRTKNKSKNIYILYDNKIVDDLKPLAYVYQDKILNKEFKALIDDMIDYSHKPCFDDNYKNIALKNTIETALYIKKLKNNGWSDDDIAEWEYTRDWVLKNPTTNYIDDKNGCLYLQLPNANNNYYAHFKSNEKIEKIEFDADFSSGIGEKYNYLRANLQSILNIPGVRAFFKNNGYKTFLDKCNYMLNPLAFDSIYKGAIGEVVGKFLIKKELGKDLSSIKDNDLYEKFDYFYNDVYIDFKNRNKDSTNPKDEFKKISNKLKKCNGRVALIINIIKPITEGNVDFKIHYEGNDIVVIPYLYDADANKNNEAFLKINELLAH